MDVRKDESFLFLIHSSSTCSLHHSFGSVLDFSAILDTFVLKNLAMSGKKAKERAKDHVTSTWLR